MRPLRVLEHLLCGYTARTGSERLLVGDSAPCNTSCAVSSHSRTLILTACRDCCQQVQAAPGARTLPQLLDALEAELDAAGLDALAPGQALGALARPRRHEIAAALNRLRSLQVE